jgi:hypothetical protein
VDLRTFLFAGVLVLAGAAITTGAAILHPSAGWIVGGLLCAVWSWLILGDTGAET